MLCLCDVLHVTFHICVYVFLYITAGYSNMEGSYGNIHWLHHCVFCHRCFLCILPSQIVYYYRIIHDVYYQYINYLVASISFVFILVFVLRSLLCYIHMYLYMYIPIYIEIQHIYSILNHRNYFTHTHTHTHTHSNTTDRVEYTTQHYTTL